MALRAKVSLRQASQKFAEEGCYAAANFAHVLTHMIKRQE